MSIFYINTGTSPNRGDGDSLRTAFNKINLNFSYLASFTNTNNVNTVTTGEVTFDGIKIIGAGSASGDDNGYSTIELVPDNNLYNNDQYLVIDPTAPNHIHIRAGGTQDNSNAQLIIGGEKNNFKVLDNTGVYLYTESVSSNNFEFDSGATFTSGSWYEDTGSYYVEFITTDSTLINTFWSFSDTVQNTLEIYDGTNYNTVHYDGWASSLGGNVYKVKVNTAPPTNPTTVLYMSFNIYTTNSNNVSLAGNDFSVNVENNLYLNGNGNVGLNNNSTNNPVSISSNNKVWTFGADGKLTLPNGSMLKPAIVSEGATILSANSGLWVGLENNNGYNSVTVDDNQVAVMTTATNIWRFLNNGKFRFPDGSDQTTAWTGAVSTLTSTVSPATGNRVTGARPPDGAGANLGYVWIPSPPAELVSIGDITGYTISWDQGQWTTTVVQMRNDLGTSWAIQTADAFPAYSSGNTYTYTSPDYVPSSPNPLDIVVGANTWTFSTSGILTFPDGSTPLVRINTIPPSTNSTGTVNQVVFDDTVIYVCTAPNNWIKFTGTRF